MKKSKETTSVENGRVNSIFEKFAKGCITLGIVFATLDTTLRISDDDEYEAGMKDLESASFVPQTKDDQCLYIDPSRVYSIQFSGYDDGPAFQFLKWLPGVPGETEYINKGVGDQIPLIAASRCEDIQESGISNVFNDRNEAVDFMLGYTQQYLEENYDTLSDLQQEYHYETAIHMVPISK